MDNRWYLLKSMGPPTADAVRQRRNTDECGMFEAKKRIKREQLLSGLEVLHTCLVDGEDADKVLHDLIEIVRELV